MNRHENIKAEFPHPIDARQGSWVSVLAAIEGVPLRRRYVGLTVGIDFEDGVKEYWWKEGIEDLDLVEKNLFTKVFFFNDATDWTETGGGFFIDFEHAFGSKVKSETRAGERKISVETQTITPNIERIYVPHDLRFGGSIVITK